MVASPHGRCQLTNLANPNVDNAHLQMWIGLLVDGDQLVHIGVRDGTGGELAHGVDGIPHSSSGGSGLERLKNIGTVLGP